MGAKDIHIKLIDKPSADAIVKRFHYSGKVTQNSQLNFGIFKNNKLLGAAQFGPSIDKRRMGQSLGVGMNEVIELNRLAISDELGKNTESRTLAVCIRLIKKNYPHLKCIVSFADACQCGDGAIYRAAGFKLLSFKKNTTLLLTPTGEVVADKTFNNNINKKHKGFTKSECSKLVGYQMKYIYCLDKGLEKKHKWITFNNIPSNVRMYKGEKRG